MNLIQKRQQRTLKTVYTALCISLCIVLPQAFHLIPVQDVAKIFSPIHIPVLLCGLLCGWQYGLICGICGPLLSFVLTGMPNTASLFPMLVECGLYGLVCGLLFKLIRTKFDYINLLSSIICAMLVGRVAAGAFRMWILTPGAYSLDIWLTSYFIKSLPGIITDIVIIPPVALALRKLSMFR